MADLKVFIYKKCGTCRKALKWLDERKMPYEVHPIRETPPSRQELKQGLQTMGGIRKILNTSSQDYRDLGLKDQLDSMDEEKIFSLMQENGNLVKRPFVVKENDAFAGFKPEDWEKRLS